MLESLHIENIAVIRAMDVDFGEGLCVLTGETGAGKSLLIDSVSFLLGGRVSRELIRAGEDRALVSAVFSCPEGEVQAQHSAFTGTTRRNPRLWVGLPPSRTASRRGRTQ